MIRRPPTSTIFPNTTLFRSQKLKENKATLRTIANSDKANAKDEADFQLKALMQKLMFTNTGLYKKFLGDEDFRNRYEEFIFDMLWQEVKSVPLQL